MNKSQKLFLLDITVGIFLLPIAALIGIFKKLSQKIYATKKINDQKIIIKFLGAGNFLALKDTLETNYLFLTTQGNSKALLESFPNNKQLLINDRNIITLIISSIKIIIGLVFNYHYQIINLESESNFAKFISAISNTKLTSGITNKNKSVIDYLIYTNYFVNTDSVSKPQLLNELILFSENINFVNLAALKKHQQEFQKKKSLNKLEKIIIAPSCSDTDFNRRLDYKEWAEIIKECRSNKNIKEVIVLFSSKNDPQYSSFKKMEDELVCIKTPSYEEFLELIKKTDLLITIDSQALHVGQMNNINTVCFYGPTNPFSINIKETTYPISKSNLCSPCTHKYIKLPCGNNSFCNKNLAKEFNLVKIYNNAK